MLSTKLIDHNYAEIDVPGGQGIDKHFFVACRIKYLKGDAARFDIFDVFVALVDFGSEQTAQNADNGATVDPPNVVNRGQFESFGDIEFRVHSEQQPLFFGLIQSRIRSIVSAPLLLNPILLTKVLRGRIGPPIIRDHTVDGLLEGINNIVNFSVHILFDDVDRTGASKCVFGDEPEEDLECLFEECAAGDGRDEVVLVADINEFGGTPAHEHKTPLRVAHKLLLEILAFVLEQFVDPIEVVSEQNDVDLVDEHTPVFHE